MTLLDERILEQLSSEGTETSWEVGFKLSGAVSLGRVTERCKVLVDAELVEREKREIGFGRVETYWSITTWGRLYLSEEVDPDSTFPSPVRGRRTRRGPVSGRDSEYQSK
jgi:hypothetical protein